MNNQTNSNAKPMYTGPAPLTGGYPQGQIQQQAQQKVPYQGMYNGNPGGAYNMPSRNQGNMNQQYGYAPSPYNMQYQGGQSAQLGRYTPPTMQQGNAFLQQGLYNSNQWNNNGGYQYNLPNSYGQTGLNYGQGQGQAPMPPYQGMSGQAQGFYNQMGQQFNQNMGQSPMQQTNFGQMGQMTEQAQGSYGQLQGQYNQNIGQMMNRQQWQGANAGVGSAPTVDDTAARQALFDQRANDLRQRQWNNVLEPRGGRVNFPGGG